MNKTTRMLAGVLLLAGFAVVAPTSAGASDARGPACGDYTSGEAFYEATSQPGQPVVHATLYVAAPSCANVAYTFYVLDESGQQQLLEPSSPTGTDGQEIKWDVSVPVDPLDPATSVCVYAKSAIGNHEVDRAPDVGCHKIKIGDKPGQAWN